MDPDTATQGETSELPSRPTIAELHGQNEYAQIAKKHWMGSANPPKVKQTVVKELWENLEKEGFPFGALLILENLQVLER